MKLTKNDMARVIITALYNRPALVAADNPLVIKIARRKAEGLALNYQRAVRILEARDKTP